MARTSIVIVGGGVIGTSIAWHLAAEGHADVMLLERDRLGSGTTWHSAGNITWKPSPAHDEPILLAYQTIAQLEAETGQSTGWLKTGRQFLVRSAETKRNFEGFHAVSQERGLGGRWIDGKEARRLNPLLDPAAVEAIWLNPLSGRLNPADLTAAYAAGARKRGAKVIEGCTVTRLETRGGRVTGVATSQGPFAADEVVLAAGLWSRALLLPLDVALAQWPCEHIYIIADIAPRLPRETPSFVAPDNLIYGREEVGGLLVGFFDENAKTIDPADLPEPFVFTLFEPDHDQIAAYFKGAMEIFPQLERAPIRKFINGPETFTPDGLPMIGRAPGLDGLVLATAMNSAGVTWSAMTGRIVCDVIAGRTLGFDGTRYDPARFGAAGRDTMRLKQAVSTIVSGGYRNQNK